MNSFFAVILVLAAAATPALRTSNAKCAYEAVFNFGDSNSDTGGYSSSFPPLDPPNGMTYFKEPAGRLCDGRLIIDFLAQAMGVPLLSPYLQSLDSDFRHGANFAVVSAAVLRKPKDGASPFSLSVQLDQFKRFKLKVQESNSSSVTPLPASDIFGKSLYPIYIGQNDFTKDLSSLGSNETLAILQNVVIQIANTTKEIYELGGRTFLVFNLAPVGCYPFAFDLVKSSNTSDIDSSGCLISCNKAVDVYNSMLKASLDQMRKQLPYATLTYVDSHSALLKIFNTPTSYGFEKPATTACRLGESVCSDPGKYVHWDGTHLTEAANKVVATQVLGGSYFDPPFPITQFCDIQHVG